MKGKSKYLVLLLLLLVVCSGLVTYAIYRTNKSGNANINAARWNVVFKNGEEEISNNFDISLNNATWKNDLGNVATGKIAPGSYATFYITIDASNTETDVDYTVELEDTFNESDFEVTLSEDSGTIAYSTAENAMIRQIPIRVVWNGNIDDNNDKNENDLLKIARDITIPIKITAAQKLVLPYTITFNSNGGNNLSFSSKQVNVGGVYGSLPTVSKDGYTLLGWSLLPQEYQQVEYIESTGTQYIDTGYYANQNTKIMFEAMITDTRTESIWTQITGARNEYHGSNAIQVGYNLSTNLLAIDYGTSYSPRDNISKNTKFNVNIEYNNIHVNNTKKEWNGVFNGTSSYSLWIFDDNDAGASESKSIFRLYSYKIYDDGVITRNFIPCYRISDNVIGLYDTVNNVFYTNRGTGTFKKGDNSSYNYINQSTTVSLNENHTLYAIWAKNLTATFNSNGGTQSFSSKEVTIGNNYGNLPTISNEGYTFVGWSILPKEYMAVEYIESTGTQYIDTGYYANPKTKIELEAMITDTRTDSIWTQLTGARNSYRSLSAIQLAYNPNNNTLAIDYGTEAAAGTNISKNTKFTVNLEYNNLLVNNSKKSWNGSFSETSPYSLWIFDDNNAGSSENKSRYRLYSYRIYDDGIITRNFIPCYRISDNVIGLYDTVNNVFYTNRGTGTFKKGNISYNNFINESSIVYINKDHTLHAIWGESITVTFNSNGGELDINSKEVVQNYSYGDLPTPTKDGYNFVGWRFDNNLLPSTYQSVEYIESTGSQYINTGYYANANTKIEMELMVTDSRTTDTWTQLTGARNSYHASSAIQVAYNLSRNRIVIDYGTSGIGAAVSKNTKASVNVEYNNIVVNNNKLNWGGSYSGTSSYSLWIFDDNNAGSSESKSIFRLYSYKIYDNGIIKRNFVPCYRKSDGVVGLYDTVYGTFYTKSGSGDLIKGSNIDYYITSTTPVTKSENHVLNAIWEN